jgi:hypothetical protein
VPIISGGGGGGGGTEAKHGTSVSLSTNLVGLGNGTTILFDTVVWSSETYYNPATGIFTIPAGRGGIYQLCGYGELLAGAALTSFQYQVLIGGAFPDNIVMSGSTAGPGNTVWDLSGAAIVQFAAGNAFHVNVQLTGPATADRISGASGFGCYLLGA